MSLQDFQAKLSPLLIDEAEAIHAALPDLEPLEVSQIVGKRLVALGEAFNRGEVRFSFNQPPEPTPAAAPEPVLDAIATPALPVS